MSELRRVWEIRRSLERVVAFADAQPQSFARADVTQNWLLEDRRVARTTWIAAMDHVLALEEEAARAASAAKNKTMSPEEKHARFAAGVAAWAGKYRWLEAWSKRCDRDPRLVRLMDDPIPELGLGKGSYAALKTRLAALRKETAFDSVAALYGPFQVGAETDRALGPKGAGAARELEDELRRLGSRSGLKTPPLFKDDWWRERPELFDVKAAHAAGKGRDIARDTEGVTPLGASGRGFTLCTGRFEELEDALRPGDVILSRVDPLSGDVGLGGWWNSAAVYLGPREETACRPKFLASSDDGLRLLTLPELSARGPLAALRPRLSDEARAQAAQRAQPFFGRPYDFHFDLESPDAMTGIEVARHAYGDQIAWPTAEFLGRKALAANAVAEAFDAEFGRSSATFDLIWFLDKDAKASSLEEFRRSWRRPKWSSSTPADLPGPGALGRRE
ncbi:MAG: hypothetical protein HY078_01795 [Elusimicrobia bacterium]|nr:hypothetical protein [Elusimicrobiota bacterium]